MIAGRGITHSERERPEVTAKPHRDHDLHLWLALPEDQVEIEPAFHHYVGADIPAVEVEGVPVRVMMGSAYGVTSAVRIFSDTLYVEALPQPGKTRALPATEELGLYVASGALKTGETGIPEHRMAILRSNSPISVEATAETRVAMVGGKRLSPRHISWNFVSSRRNGSSRPGKTEAGRFAKVTGDEEDFTPLQT